MHGIHIPILNPEGMIQWRKIEIMDLHQIVKLLAMYIGNVKYPGCLGYTRFHGEVIDPIAFKHLIHAVDIQVVDIKSRIRILHDTGIAKGCSFHMYKGRGFWCELVLMEANRGWIASFQNNLIQKTSTFGFNSRKIESTSPVNNAMD